MGEPAERVVVVGSGYWGRNLVRNFHALGALAGVCDSSPAALDDVRKSYAEAQTWSSFAEVLASDVPAVVIATPAATHGALVRRALEAGKDVFVEKPLCLAPAEGRALVELAGRQGRVLMIGHLLQYHPAVVKLRELVTTGALGRLQYIYSTRLNLGRVRREENILWSFAPHDISVILGLVGEMPSSVKAEAGNFLHSGISDVTMSVLSFPGGAKAHVFVSWLHPFKEQKLVVVGDRQMAVFDDGEPERKLVIYPHAITWMNQQPVAHKADGRVVELENIEPLRAECLHFLERVRDRALPRTDGAEALRVLSVLQQCQDACTQPGVRSLPAEESTKKTYKAHDSAFIDDGVEIGSGTTIWHVSHLMRGTTVGTNCRIGQNVVIGPNVSVGNGVKIQNNVSVYEGVTLEDDVFCGPSMVFTNVLNPRSEVPRMNELQQTLVRRGATLGANCTVVCGSTIGRYAFIAAGAVVTTDVEDYALMMGVPARRVGWICRCGVRLTLEATTATCASCTRTYEERSGRLVEQRSETSP